MDAAENLRAYGGDPSHSMHPDAYITQGSYTFMNGAMDAPLKDGSGAPIEDSGGVEAQQSSTSGLGTLYTNNQLAAGASFNASRSPPVPSSTNSWELTINGGAGGSLYAGGSSLPNILINGSGLMASNSNPTAQLLIGGLQSFNETDHGTVYYPPSQGQHAHAEAMQLVYVNGGGYGHHNSFDRGLAYNNGQDHSTSDNNNQNSSAQQSAYGVSFLSQPLMEQPRQSYSNWQRTGGNEHSFLPVNDVEPQSHHSLFGAVLQGRNDHEQQQLAQQVMATVEGTTNHSQGAGSNSNIAVNGQGMLSLSLSSHQPHFQQLQPGESASASEAQMVAQAAALAKTKELASRYLAGSGANNAADLSRFRTPTREFHHESKKPGASSSSQLTASQFLQSVQSILNELCKVTPLKRAPKPASSTEQQQYPLRSSSASVNATYNGYHGKDHDLHAAEASVGRDPQSSVASLSDASHLVTVSHIPLQAEMMTDAARSSGTGRDDLEFKKGQLIRMLDEVEARFRRYSDQLQVTCAGFNAQAGPNAATPYTILALQAMSRHFRCLKDAVKNQLKVVRRALGEEDVAAGFNGETTRLRYVDQQIRQQRALQQLGMLQQHAWRPQRGLPERAVSVLRAWLFEHFLHPYPKDVDKMSLAKQTGLTRSQVSNWFINARVRLWKPMVEEMYVEEQREAAELALQSDRMAREQVNMAYEQFEAAGNSNNNNRGREDLTANGVQHSSVMSNVEYRTTTTTTTTTTNDQDQGAGPSSLTEVASQALYRQQQQQQPEDHTFNNNYEGGPREPKRAKTALETVSDAFNSNNTVTSSILCENNNHGHGTPAAEDVDVVPSSELEARNKLKGKSVVDHVEENNMNQPSYATSQGAFVSYGESNGMNHHHRYEGVQGYVAASTAVSLTLGLRHCDAANMSLQSTTSVAPVLDKYDMDADLARMDPLDRDEYLHDARMHDHVNHGTSYHEVQQHRDHQHHGQDVEENHHGANNITQHAGNDHGLPGGASLTTPAFENHHEFTDAH